MISIEGKEGKTKRIIEMSKEWDSSKVLYIGDESKLSRLPKEYVRLKHITLDNVDEVLDEILHKDKGDFLNHFDRIVMCLGFNQDDKRKLIRREIDFRNKNSKFKEIIITIQNELELVYACEIMPAR